MKSIRSLAVVAAALLSSSAYAQYTDGVIKIGVLNDMSGVYSDSNGIGSVVAAKLAVEDFNPAAKGMKVEIVFADHQNRADVGRGSRIPGSTSTRSM
jgi:branched-chain amino acid transport system substrate-binding protein